MSRHHPIRFIREGREVLGKSFPDTDDVVFDEEADMNYHGRFMISWRKRRIEVINRNRRAKLDLMTPAELAIRDAMLAVEELPADSRLTEAINLLQQARDKVADFVDSSKQPREENGRTMNR